MASRSSYTVSTPQKQTGDSPLRLSSRDSIQHPAQSLVFSRSPKGYVVDVKRLGKFEISDDGQLTNYEAYTSDNMLVEGFIIGNIEPLLLSLRGHIVLHASVVLVGKSAVALMGPSGYGKTSVSTALLMHGCKLLSDDACRVEHGNNGSEAAPFQPYLSVPNSNPFIKSLGEVIHDGSLKKWMRVKDELFHDSPAPLTVIYNLKRGKTLHIKPLQGARAVQALLRNTYRSASIFDMEKLYGEMQTLATLVEDGLDVRSLYIPRGWNYVRRAAGMILRDVAEN